MTEGTEPIASQRRRRSAIYAGIFLFTAAEAAIHLLVPAYLSRDLGLAPVVTGAVLGAFALASLLARLPVGSIYRPGRAPWLVAAGGGLATLAYTILPLTSEPLLIGLMLAVDGLGWSVATTVLLAGLAETNPTGRSTASTMGWYLGFTGLGNAAAGASGILADVVGIRPAFLVLAALPAIATVAAALALRGLAPPPSRDPSARLAPHRSRLHPGDLMRGARSVPTAVWPAALVMVYINVISGLLNAFHPALALANGLSLSQVGILSSLRSLASSWVRLGSGLLFARVRAGQLTGPLLAAGTLAVIVLPLVAAVFWVQAILFAVVGLSRGLLRVTASATAFDAQPAADDGGGRQGAGMTSALLQSGLDVGKLAGPVLAGLVAQVAGVPGAFVIVPLGVAAGYLLLSLLVRGASVAGGPGPRRTRRPPREGPSPVDAT